MAVLTLLTRERQNWRDFMIYVATQSIRMGEGDSGQRNPGGVGVSERCVTSENTTTKQTVPTASRLPDVMVPKITEMSFREAHLSLGDCTFVPCKMARTYFGDSLNGVAKIALGLASVRQEDDDLEDDLMGESLRRKMVPQKTCTFIPTSYKALSQGAKPEHVVIRLAWSKNEGSIYEECRPFDACSVWVGKRGGLYFGRQADKLVQSERAPIHGVDYIVLPITACVPELQSTMIANYVKDLGASRMRVAVS